MGVDAFYNIFSAGLIEYTNDYSQYFVGYGVGTQKRVGKHLVFGMELVANQLVEDNVWRQVNILGQLNFDYTFLFTENIGVTFGPSINGYYTQVNNNGEWGTIDMPYDPTMEWEDNNGKFTGWFGVNAGLTFRF